MRISLDEGAFAPTRAHPTDAGLDIRAMYGGIVRAKQSATFCTGVHVELPSPTAGVLLPKSGLMIYRDILTFGVVDEGFDGEVMVHVFNLGNSDYWIEAGDKITQLLVVDVRYEPVEVVEKIGGGARGADGYGSTGR